MRKKMQPTFIESTHLTDSIETSDHDCLSMGGSALTETIETSDFDIFSRDACLGGTIATATIEDSDADEFSAAIL